MAEKGQDPYGAYKGVQALTAWVERDDWDEILPAYSRCVRITRDKETIYPVNVDHFVTESEKELYEALVKAEKKIAGSESVDVFLGAFLPMVPVINQFFDEVLVMDEDQALRENRLGLLQRISALSDDVADLSYLEGF